MNPDDAWARVRWTEREARSLAWLASVLCVAQWVNAGWVMVRRGRMDDGAAREEAAASFWFAAVAALTSATGAFALSHVARALQTAREDARVVDADADAAVPFIGLGGRRGAVGDGDTDGDDDEERRGRA